MQLFNCGYIVKSPIFSDFVVFWNWIKLWLSLFLTCLTLWSPSTCVKTFFYKVELEKPQEKIQKKQPLSGPLLYTHLKKNHRMPPGCFFFVVEVGSNQRYNPIFSVHNFCWAGNGCLSSQTVFTDTENIFSKKKTHNLPDFGTKTPRDPLVLLLNMIIGEVKIVE